MRNKPTNMHRSRWNYFYIIVKTPFPTVYCRIIAPDGLDQSAWDYSTSQAIYGLCDLPTPPRDPSKYSTICFSFQKSLTFYSSTETSHNRHSQRNRNMIWWFSCPRSAMERLHFVVSIDSLNWVVMINITEDQLRRKWQGILASKVF